MDNIAFARPNIGPAEIDAVTAVLKSGWLTSGAKTRDFEQAFADAVGAEHAVALNSCTAALHLALIALGIGDGDEVIVPTMTFAATAEVVYAVGATPVLADSRPDDLTIDPKHVESLIGENTRAVIPMHYGGRAAAMKEISELARLNDLAVVEDAAHSFPTMIDGGLVGGGDSDAACFSFYANKTITTGEGGMLTTPHAEVADRVRRLSLHGLSRDAWRRFDVRSPWDYDITEPGWKYNLTDIASAIGLVQLGRADELAESRRRIAARYDERLEALAEIAPLPDQGARSHSAHLYVVRLRGIDRNSVIEHLGAAGIGTSVHYRPLHLHSFYVGKTQPPEALPVATKAFDEILSLPNWAGMPEAMVDMVCDRLTEAVRGGGRQ